MLREVLWEIMGLFRRGGEDFGFGGDLWGDGLCWEWDQTCWCVGGLTKMSELIPIE